MADAHDLGFSATVGSVFMLMKCQQARDTTRSVFWQRNRVLSQALTISFLMMPLSMPYLTQGSILLRTTKTI